MKTLHRHISSATTSTMGGVLCALPFLATIHATEAQAKNKNLQQRPNIVFLLFDDLGYGDLGCYGQKKIETPNIDALAQRGMLFTDMYTCCPLSAPSRCSLYTGQHMGHSQVRHNVNNRQYEETEAFRTILNDSTAEGQHPLKAGTRTIATQLKQAGYATGMVGKWGLGGPVGDSNPNHMGFDYFFGHNCQRMAHTYYPPFMWENEKRVYLPNKSIETYGSTLDEGADSLDPKAYDKFTQKVYAPDIMFERMIGFIDRNAGKTPFFLMWTTTVPHSSVQAPKDEVMHYVAKLGDEKPAGPGSYYPSRYPHATYAAMVTHIDTQMGKLVAHLKELGIYDNTIIIVSSDNGPACNSNSPMEYFKSGGPFKCSKGWGKSSLHEGGVRMPFIISWGDRYKGTKVSRISSFADLMPTFCDIAGAKAPKGIDGITLLPTLTGKQDKQKNHEFLYWEFPGAKGWVAVREGDWKAIVRKVKTGNDRFELFNLKTDPREQNDVAAQHPEIVERMWKRVTASHTPNTIHPNFNLDIKYPPNIKK